MTAFMLLLFSPTQLKAKTDTEVVPATASTTVKAAEANAMVVRLNEIKAMDLSTLSSSEKRELRKEVRGIKSELKIKGESTYIQSSHGGVYISVGAAILIILLLVLLL